MDLKQLNGGSLAYIGDAVWSLMVREYLLEKGLRKLSELQNASIKFVSANSQSYIYKKLEEENFFSEEEKEVFRRGRNFKSMSSPKNTDIIVYRISTGFEALIGHLYVEKQEKRLKQIWEKVKTMIEV